MKSYEDRDEGGFQAFTGMLSGKEIRIPDVNAPPIPSIANPGVIHDGIPAEGFGRIGSASHGYQDALSFRRRFGLLVPATNTINGARALGLDLRQSGA